MDLADVTDRTGANDFHALAKAIDKHYDLLASRDLPLELAIAIERERQAAHAELTREVMAAALDGWQGPTRMR